MAAADVDQNHGLCAYYSIVNKLAFAEGLAPISVLLFFLLREVVT